MADEFTKLYLDEKQDADKIWPPFADMMTVIAMIFMLTMSVIVLRNWELVDKLKASLKTERELVHTVRRQSAEKSDLSSKLTDRENELSMLQMQALNLQNDVDQLQQDNAKLQADWDANQKQLHLAQEKMAQDAEEMERMREQVALREQDLEQVRAQEASAREVIKGNEQEITRLTREARQLGSTLQTAEERIAEFEKRATKHEEAYSALKVKYDRLIRPARSSKGKVVVEIRCAKIGNDLEILYKGPGQANFVKEGKEQLYKNLEALKVQYPASLYLKIVFPKGDDISHNDAWQFTSELLSRYDYYYQ